MMEVEEGRNNYHTRTIVTGSKHGGQGRKHVPGNGDEKRAAKGRRSM